MFTVIGTKPNGKQVQLIKAATRGDASYAAVASFRTGQYDRVAMINQHGEITQTWTR